MAAAHKGVPESIQLLVDRGAKLETRDKGSRDTHIVDLSGHGDGRPSITRMDSCELACSLPTHIRKHQRYFAA
jgi:hypothetical protein